MIPRGIISADGHVCEPANCYIDYIDGEYFLFDLLHPGIRIAVFVVI